MKRGRRGGRPTWGAAAPVGLARGRLGVMATAVSRDRARPSAGPVDDGPSGREEPLDTTVKLVTPERIVFRYPLAGPFRRAFAYALDLILLVVLTAVAVFACLALTLFSASGLGLAFVAYFLLDWGYRAGLEAFWNGQTVGKKVAGIRVVSDQGVPITGAQAVLRNLVGAVDGAAPFCYLPGLVSVFLTKKFQRLGDLAAGTMVVVEERRDRVAVPRVNERAVADLLPWLPLRVAAGPDLARALSDYVKRRGRFRPALREEMAAPLAGPLRARFGLPASTAGDAVLCAVYHRVFFGE